MELVGKMIGAQLVGSGSTARAYLQMRATVNGVDNDYDISCSVEEYEAYREQIDAQAGVEIEERDHVVLSVDVTEEKGDVTKTVAVAPVEKGASTDNKLAEEDVAAVVLEPARAYELDSGAFVVADHRGWLPGVYDSEEAAKLATKLTVEQLVDLQETKDVKGSDTFSKEDMAAAVVSVALEMEL